MKRMKTAITFTVPAWEFCNGHHHGKHSKDTCRFCVKRNNGYTCLLYNKALYSSEGFIVHKTPQCYKDTIVSSEIVEDVVQVDPQVIMKSTIKEYNKIVKALLKQGYTNTMASKVAQDMIIGGK